MKQVWLTVGLAAALLAPAALAKPTAPQCSAGAVCGGVAGLRCEQGYYCGFPPGRGRPDQTGVCKLKPRVCPRIFKPVCGRDGTTYPNACEAASRGVSVLSEGACPP